MTATSHPVVPGDLQASKDTGAAVVHNSPTFSPLYQQIKGLIMKSLGEGEWRPGEMIPSEVELAGRFRVSQGTVRKAIDALSSENLVVRKQGKGTFVATHHEPRSQFRFLRLQSDTGDLLAAENLIIDVKRLRAPTDVARLLEMKAGESIVAIKRLQSFENVPTIVDDILLPALLFRGLTAERLVSYKGPMYGLFETEFGTRMIRASEKLKAVVANADSARLLLVEQGTPLLGVERVSFSYGDRPVEVRRSLYLTAAHHYQNELG